MKTPLTLKTGLLAIFLICTVSVSANKTISVADFGLKPDIISLAKALGGGFPMGAMVAKDEIAQYFKPVLRSYFRKGGMISGHNTPQKKNIMKLIRMT